MLDSNLGRKAAAAALLACLFGAGHAQSIPMHQSRDLSNEQYKARDLSVEQPREQPRRTQSQPSAPGSASASALMGAWSTSVPGRIYL